MRELDPTVMERLARHDWPGNMRKLRNVVERVRVATNLWLDRPNLHRRIRHWGVGPRRIELTTA